MWREGKKEEMSALTLQFKKKERNAKNGTQILLC
jgi:hypothetical protein